MHNCAKTGSFQGTARVAFTDDELCTIAAEKAARFPDDPMRAAIELLDLERYREPN